MDILENIGKKATQTYKYATGKTGKIAKETKLKMSISSNKSEIEDIYAEIGKKVYEEYVQGEEISDKYIQDCIEIDTLANEIENARQKILELNEKKECPNCYAQIDIECTYCPKCGKNQEEADKQAIELKEKNEHHDCDCKKTPLQVELENESHKCECGEDCDCDNNSEEEN